jgi:hypothetical protein
MTDHDVIRKRLYEQKGLCSFNIERDFNCLICAIIERILPFFNLMYHRILMGEYRYGPIPDYPVNWLRDVERTIGNYKRTGNTEFLVDAANYVMLEFLHGNHPEKHFAVNDDGEHSERRAK